MRVDILIAVKDCGKGKYGGLKMSTFGIHRLDWLMVSKSFLWNT